MRNAPNRNHVPSARVLASHVPRETNQQAASRKTAIAIAHQTGGRQARIPVQRPSEKTIAAQNSGWRGGFGFRIMLISAGGFVSQRRPWRSESVESGAAPKRAAKKRVGARYAPAPLQCQFPAATRLPGKIEPRKDRNPKTSGQQRLGDRESC
jgi:hypothetical protein